MLLGFTSMFVASFKFGPQKARDLPARRTISGARQLAQSNRPYITSARWEISPRRARSAKSAPVTKSRQSSTPSPRSIKTMSGRTQLWVEKYRPTRIDDLASQEEVTKTLRGAIAQGQLPHLLMYGPPGTGKTSTILAVARTLYHPSVLKDRVLEMNASDERGIKVVRDKIKNFASHSVSSQKFDGYPSPPFKIIILDECDSMTKDAQGALRRTMEVYSSTTRFCLICNYVSRIIEPLVSRCAKLRFSPSAGTRCRSVCSILLRRNQSTTPRKFMIRSSIEVVET